MALAKYKIEAIFQALDQAIPNPESDLTFRNNFELLISVILSAQATDKAVNLVTPKLFELAPTPEKMAALGLEKIRNQIKTLGLFNNKAKALVSCATTLFEQHNSIVPDNRAELEALAGVGKKTAGVVLNVAFGEPTIPVDTHVFRLSNRLGLVNTKSAENTEPPLLKVVPDWVKPKAHHLLILHGRYVCKARKPDCALCPVTQYCKSYPKFKKLLAL